MGLSEQLEKVKGLSESDKQSMTERIEELKESGKSNREADLIVLDEMKKDIDADMASLKKQLRIKPPTGK